MDVSEFELERLLLAKMAERECQNLIGRYCHYRTACRTDDILAVWSAEPDARVEMPWGVYDGPEGVRRLFTQELTAHDDLSARRGKLDIDALNNGVIEVAADVKTARGAWFSQGLRTRADQGEAECSWYWTKLAVDFRYEAGGWKLWHMAYFPMLASPVRTPWYDVPKLTAEQFSAYHPDRKPTARTLWSFHKDNQYPLGHPATPKPYDNFDLEVGYGY